MDVDLNKCIGSLVFKVITNLRQLLLFQLLHFHHHKES